MARKPSRSTHIATRVPPAKPGKTDRAAARARRRLRHVKENCDEATVFSFEFSVKASSYLKTENRKLKTVLAWGAYKRLWGAILAR
jgi:hypothetical protein